MITALFSIVGVIGTCIALLITVGGVFFVRWYVFSKRKPNEKQIRALRVMLPTDAERPSELHPVDLERLAAYVYERLGYRNVKHTGVHSTTDGGVDVWMLNRRGFVEIVQCKQWRTPVGSSELIEFAKVMRQQHAEVGHYWSPMGYTKPAKQYAERADNILLLDDYQIRMLLEKAIEVDKEKEKQAQIQPKPIPQKTTWTVTQIVVIFGMMLVICFVVYLVLATIATSGGK